MGDHSISSPAATGGAGTFYEQHVGAYWLAQLLVGGIPPILIDTTVQEVHFQTEHLGWQTDDFLVVGARPDGRQQKLIGQVKRSFTVSAKDDECRKTVQDFWSDFNSPARFSHEHDRLVLITLRGTNTLLEHLSGLLDCARAAPDGEAFEERLAASGFISGKAVEYCSVLREIAGAVDGEPITAPRIWPFLRALHVLNLDLNSSTRQTEAATKSLLAHTVRDGDALAGASASWNALLGLASTAIPAARSLRRADLPAELQQRHGVIGVDEQRVLQALKDHSVPVLDRIRGTIGSFHLPRGDTVQEAHDALGVAHVVIVSGPAGSGKSAIAKDLASLLAGDHFVFAFRAEEFAEAHIDRTLQAAQVGASAAKLAAILGGQERTFILIESVERLLEKPTRDAFSDFMHLVANDARFCVVLTCRDYSRDLVCASLLQPEGIAYQSVPVPPLTDHELERVAAAVTPLSYPLAKPELRDILRNPYLLDRALQIEWSDRPAPESEREFRERFWRQVVRADEATGGGMPQRREQIFQSIAVRRASALTEFVTCSDLDLEAVAALRGDSLIVSPVGRLSVVATAHDVLEDWAILHWLEEQHAGGERSLSELSEAIGPYPAIRRSYRTWIAELVARDPAAADRLFRAAVAPAGVSAQFRDDTLVALLKAPTAGEFLDRHEAELVADDCAVLRRLIHLLRVACVTSLPWLADVKDLGSISSVPEGAAWEVVLGLAHRNLEQLSAQDEPLLLGLIEDAVRGVTWRAPELVGAEFVAGIAHSLLPEDDYYGSDKWRNRVLSVLARIPNADSARFGAILTGRRRSDAEQDPPEAYLPAAIFPGRRQRIRRRDPVADDLRTLLFSGSEGLPSARDLPDLIVSVAKEYLLATEEDVLNGGSMGSGLDLGLRFGIRANLDHHFFPPSAVRGLWLPLLRYHPDKGRDLIIDVFNHSADWYAHPRVVDPLEPAWETELTFADGTRRKQWANPRLWQLYRGTSVGPYALHSLLMAFEKWLLEYADTYPEQLDAILVDTLRRSESVMLTGVVASVATAHPHLAGEALLVLLSAPSFIRLDQARVAAERGTFSVSDIFGGVRAETAIHDGERKQADKMPHRKAHLEVAVASLQFGPFAPRAHATLDRHFAALEANPEQNDNDLAWRLALHRMDLRRYAVSAEEEPESGIAPDSNAEEERSPLRIRLDPKALGPELQRFVEFGRNERAGIGSQLEVLGWGFAAFQRERGDDEPDRWREMLQRAQDIERQVEDGFGARNAPGFVAAIAVRDHWEELSSDERAWCVEVACSEVERTCDVWTFEARVERFEMAADRPSATALSLLVRRALAETQFERVRQAWAAVLTHPVDEVRSYGAGSIDAQFWAEDYDLALRSANAIATHASLVDEALAIEAKQRWDQRRDYSEIGAETALSVRHRFREQGGVADDAYRLVSVARGAGEGALQNLLVIFGHLPANRASVEVFARASTTLVAWWNSDREPNKNPNDEQERNFAVEIAVSNLLARFVLRMDPPSARTVLEPMLSEVDSHPDRLADFVRRVTLHEDSEPNPEQYWYVWNLFAERINQAGWLGGLDREHPRGSDMLSAMFLTYGWKDEVRHWRSLEGRAHSIHALFESLPATAIVLDDYLRFLYHVGERSLPEAFVRVARALRNADPRRMLAVSNTVFLLEVLLQRQVYGRPLQLKREPELREAVLELLDALVEAGSSAAFRMRDDFVTPA